METIQLRQLIKDLDSYCFRIRFIEGGGQEGELHFYVPGFFGKCAIRLHEESGTLKIQTETLTQPNGPETEEFAERAGVPNMTSPEEYGLATIETEILLAHISELRIQRWHGANDFIHWRRERSGTMTRRRSRGRV